MSEKKYVIEANATTGEQVRREFTAEEYAQAEVDAANYAERRAAEEAEATRIATLKASAKAKLIAGQRLTAEEADTLIV